MGRRDVVADTAGFTELGFAVLVRGADIDLDRFFALCIGST